VQTNIFNRTTNWGKKRYEGDWVVTFIILGAVTGASLALLRYTALQLVPVSALFAIASPMVGTAFGLHPEVIAADALASIAALQFSFVAVSLTNHVNRSAMQIPEMQAAIGHQLRSELEVPRSLPPKIGVLVTRLAAADQRIQSAWLKQSGRPTTAALFIWTVASLSA
jgi:hypothetical protein